MQLHALIIYQCYNNVYKCRCNLNINEMRSPRKKKQTSLRLRQYIHNMSNCREQSNVLLQGLCSHDFGFFHQIVYSYLIMCCHNLNKSIFRRKVCWKKKFKLILNNISLRDDSVHNTDMTRGFSQSSHLARIFGRRSPERRDGPHRLVRRPVWEFLLVGRLQDLERAHKRLVDAHHGASIVKLSAVVWR
jgi:hypothetical protein